MCDTVIKFCKLNPSARIPSKRGEDLGFDVYPCVVDTEIVINPGETKVIPTGLGVVLEPGWGIIVEERGSTGKIGLSRRAGVMDTGYRGEYMILVSNISNKRICITDNPDTAFPDDIVYPMSKAIAQLRVVRSPIVDVQEISLDEFQSYTSDRGEGRFGSSGK